MDYIVHEGLKELDMTERLSPVTLHWVVSSFRRLRIKLLGFLGGPVVNNPPHRFDPWCRKSPPASEQLSS